MEAVFLKLVNMSINASWLVLAVILFRLLLKRAPKYIRVALWGLVGLRLLFPFSIESVLSLIPSAEPLPQEFLYAAAPQINTGIPAVNNSLNPIIAQTLAPAELTSANPTQILSFIFSCIWILGMALMLLYAIVSCYLVRRKVGPSIPMGKNLRLCDNIDTPFILGIFRPKIYLPSSLDEATAVHVLAHEKAHLQRKDHWWKPLGFGLLTVYWFNPVMWLAYVLLCRDIELACDEKVIRDLNPGQKKAYSAALLSCSVPRHMIAACPLAFGEVGVKKRIKSVLNYKKPAFWIIVVAVIASIVVAVCFLTDPEQDTSDQWAAECKAVLDQIQNSNIYSLQVDRKYDGEAVLNTSSSSQYLKYGSYRLHVVHIPDDNSTHTYLDAEGNYYEGILSDGDYSWEQTESPESSAFAPWLCSYQWNEKEAKAIARVDKHDGYYIRLKVLNRYSDTHLSYDDYHVDFYFNHDGTFQYAIQSIHAQSEFMGKTVPLSITAEMRPIGASEDRILSFITGFTSNLEEKLNINLDIPPAADRLAPGEYVTTEVTYWPLYSSYFWSEAPSYRYIVSENGFYSEYENETFDVYWQWRRATDCIKELKFFFDWYKVMEEMGIQEVPAIDDSFHYQKIDTKHHLMLIEDALYLVEGCDTGVDLTNVSAIFRLEPDDGSDIPVTYPEETVDSQISSLYSTISGQIYDSRSAQDALIRNAIMSSRSVHKSDDVFYAESHQILSEAIACGADNGDGSPIGYRVFDVMAVLMKAERTDSGVVPYFSPEYEYINATITIDEFADGTLKLSKYQENDVGELTNYDLMPLKQHCFDQTVRYWGMDTGLMVDSLLDTISSSPAQYSFAGPYIEAHPEEFETLLHLGEHTLISCFNAFLNHHVSGIRAEIMAAACRDIGKTMGEDIDFEGHYINGSTWFDVFHAEALRLYKSDGLDALAETNRASWVLLNILGQTPVPAPADIAAEIVNSEHHSNCVSLFVDVKFPENIDVGAMDDIQIPESVMLGYTSDRGEQSISAGSNTVDSVDAPSNTIRYHFIFELYKREPANSHFSLTVSGFPEMNPGDAVNLDWQADVDEARVFSAKSGDSEVILTISPYLANVEFSNSDYNSISDLRDSIQIRDMDGRLLPVKGPYGGSESKYRMKLSITLLEPLDIDAIKTVKVGGLILE